MELTREQIERDREWLKNNTPPTLWHAVDRQCDRSLRTHDAEAECERLRAVVNRVHVMERALRNLVVVIEGDGLIPESVSYMREARKALSTPIPGSAPTHTQGCQECGQWDQDEDGRLMCVCSPERYARFHAPHTPKQTGTEKRDSYLNLAGRIIEQRGGDNRYADSNALDSFNEVMADFHELTGLDPNANPKVGQIREALTAGDTPEQAHGDALAALDEIMRTTTPLAAPHRWELAQKIAQENAERVCLIRRHLTASGVPKGDYHEGFEEGMRAGHGVPEDTKRLLRDLRLWMQGDRYRFSDNLSERESWSTMIGRIDKALASAPADGWKLVPVEPTDQMIGELITSTATDQYTNENRAEIMRSNYRRMIAAAPQRGGE